MDKMMMMMMIGNDEEEDGDDGDNEYDYDDDECDDEYDDDDDDDVDYDNEYDDSYDVDCKYLKGIIYFRLYYIWYKLSPNLILLYDCVRYLNMFTIYNVSKELKK